MWSGRRTRAIPFVALSLLFATFLSVKAAGASLCPVQIDGRDASSNDSPGTALAITDLKRPLALTGHAPPGSGSIQIEIVFEPVVVPVSAPAISGGGDWAAQVDPATYVNGVGLYHVRARTTTGCASDVWLLIEGSPLSTLAGRLAAGTLVVGGLLQLVGIFRRSLLSSVLFGLPTGIGAAVLAQQAGVTPLDGQTVAIWSGSSMGVGGVANILVSTIRPGSTPEFRRRSTGTDVARDAPTAAIRVEPAAGGSAEPSAVGAPAATADRPPARSTRSGSRAQPPPGTTRAKPPPATPRGQPAAATRETPRRSFAKLECPDAVVSGREFELTVGLSPEPVAGVAFGEIVRPRRITGGYTLTIHVVGDGMRVRSDDLWRRDVEVTADAPYPEFALHLTPELQGEDVRERTIQAYFSIGGEPVGFAARQLRVLRHADVAAGPPPARPVLGAAVAGPIGSAADLTIHIARGKSEADGRFRWIMVTPHAVPLPDEPLMIDLGDKPDVFARKIAAVGATKDGHPGLYLHMVGVGRQIADQIPAAFWDVLSAVNARVKPRPPTILISTDEPYVPWELAVVEPALDPNAPPFLGAQAVVGRWVPGIGSATKPPRPPLVPPPTVQVSAMAVVWGRYEKMPLLEAEREAQEIVAAYGALNVSAVSVDVLRVVGRGDPRAELLHFALHGRYDPDGEQDGLILVDGEMLEPAAVLGATLQWAPFVFLNACQVGSGEKVLGDYAGLAHAFLRAGASGVVAPLWSVRDDVARELAVRFYQLLFTGVSPADVLRRERARFKDSPDTVTATFLAYQYFGHPALRVSR
jgi:CHAT domain